MPSSCYTNMGEVLTTKVCNAWPVLPWLRSCNLWLPSQSQSINAHWSVPNYTAWW